MSGQITAFPIIFSVLVVVILSIYAYLLHKSQTIQINNYAKMIEEKELSKNENKSKNKRIFVNPAKTKEMRRRYVEEGGKLQSSENQTEEDEETDDEMIEEGFDLFDDFM